MIDWSGLFGLFGPLSITVALLVIGLLSRRLGSVLRTPPYHIGLFIAALLMAVSVLARLVNIGRGVEDAVQLASDPLWVLLYIGFPAMAITLGIVIAWRYWSWLLAERG